MDFELSAGGLLFMLRTFTKFLNSWGFEEVVENVNAFSAEELQFLQREGLGNLVLDENQTSVSLDIDALDRLAHRAHLGTSEIIVRASGELVSPRTPRTPPDEAPFITQEQDSLRLSAARKGQPLTLDDAFHALLRLLHRDRSNISFDEIEAYTLGPNQWEIVAHYLP